MKDPKENIKHNKEGFVVPEGYFEKMKAEVLQKNFPPKKRILLLNNNVMKYAAILMIGLFVAGGWYYLQSSQETEEWYANAVESELYSYEYAMLDEYTMVGNESELANSEDSYLVNSEYGSELLMSDEE